MTSRSFLFALGLAWASLTSLQAEEAKPSEPAKPVEAPKPAEEKKQADVVKVILETSKGIIELELDAAKAPISAANFVKYVKNGHYDGTIFHRVIPGFMIQAGNFLPNMEEKMNEAPIKNESQNGLKNARGTLAMARTNVPDSATSQFFINVKDNANLDYPSFDGVGYAVFGKVTKGMDVVDAIVGVPTAKKGPHGDVPVEPITIKSAKITE